MLVVPGLMIAARWSLLIPVLMLEEVSLGEARDRSTKLVQEHTGSVLAVMLIVIAVCVSPFVLSAVFVDDFWVRTLLGALTSILVTPLYAVATSVVYYRLTDTS